MTSPIIAKKTLQVTMTLVDGTVLEGSVFLNNDERLLDLLNNGLPFLPVRLEDKRMRMLSKSVIALCDPNED